MLNGRKKPKYLVLKKPKTFMAHLGLKQHSIALYFRFLLHFYAKIGSKAHFLGQKCQIFLKKSAFGANIWRFARKILPPIPKYWRGKNILFSGIGGGACPPLPPLMCVPASTPVAPSLPHPRHLTYRSTGKRQNNAGNQSAIFQIFF